MQTISGTLRRHDLDWLRVGALGLLIVTHETYVYRTTGWRLHSSHAGLWGDLIIEALTPWRMALVFFIGGAATRFLLPNRDLWAFAVNRLLRLGVPFVVAVLFLVPPMWFAVDPQARGSGYLQYVFRTPLHAHNVYGFHLPDLGHVWFLSYLLAYALAAALVWRFIPKTVWQAAEAFVARLSIPVVMLAVATVFFLSEGVLRPVFGRTDMFFDDPAGHVRFLPPFVLGLMVARNDDFWRRLVDAGKWLTPLALVMMAVALGAAAADTLSGHTVPAWQIGLADGLYGSAMILAILSFGYRKLNRPSPQLTYLSDAILPVYLMHQPVIVLVGVVLLQAGLPAWVEYPALLAATALIPLAIYQIAIRHVGPLRVLFGLKFDRPVASAA